MGERDMQPTRNFSGSTATTVVTGIGVAESDIETSQSLSDRSGSEDTDDEECDTVSTGSSCFSAFETIKNPVSVPPLPLTESLSESVSIKITSGSILS